MPSDFQYDVFLSHSGNDKALVRPLAERFRVDGLKVWFDEWVLYAPALTAQKREKWVSPTR